MNTLTVLPLFVAMAVAIAAQALPIYAVNTWNVGTLKVEPWRAKVSSLREIAAAPLVWFARIWARHRRSLLAAAALMALLAVTQSADGAVLVAGITAEPTLAEVKKAIDESNRAWEEFKQTNDTRLKQLETKGVVDPLIQDKLDKLTAAIEKQSAINEAFMATQATVNKLKLAGLTAPDEKRELQRQEFNRSLKAMRMASGSETPSPALDADAYLAYRAAFDAYLRRGDRRLTAEEMKAISVGNDPQGGYVVTPDVTGRMVERMFETSPMRQYSSVQVISTDALEGTADIDEAAFGWVGELGTRSETNTAKVPAQWRIPVHEAYAAPRISQKNVEDANIDIAAWHGRKVGDKIGRGFNTAFVTGSGVDRPRGFASYDTEATADASRAWGKFEHILTGTNGGFGTDPNGVNKLLDLIHAVKDVYTVRAAFYLNRTTLGKARQLTDASTNGKYVFIPSFIAGTPDTFLGYPVRKLQDMATYSTTGALAIGFGDMEDTYQIVDRLGMTVLVDPYTAKPWVIYYTRARVGGDVVNFESLKFLKFSA